MIIMSYKNILHLADLAPQQQWIVVSNITVLLK